MNFNSAEQFIAHVASRNPGQPEFRGWHWTPGAAFSIRLQKMVPAA